VFALDGDGFTKIFRPRDRGYATFDMTAVVGIAASQLHHDYPGGEHVQIGDVCAKFGGQLAHHQSHQNGLDADIAYMRVNHWEQDPQHINGFEELFVKDGKISPNFDEERVWDFIKAIHGTGRLVRIFMDPVIKATLCEYAQKIGEYDSQADVLRRIRPLALHQDHMHVRLTCPQKSPQCQAQQDPPAGQGCADVMPKPPTPTLSTLID
jgi:penicillin-insensitive murein endopeptidase